MNDEQQLIETTKLPPPSRQDAQGSVLTPETTMDSGGAVSGEITDFHKLLPCPFCGNSEKLQVSLYNRPCLVCLRCDADGPSAQALIANPDNRSEARAQAIALWNKRAEPDVKDRIKTREINTLTAENRKLLDALRKAKEALEPHSKLFGVDGASQCDKCRAYAAIIEGLK